MLIGMLVVSVGLTGAGCALDAQSFRNGTATQLGAASPVGTAPAKVESSSNLGTVLLIVGAVVVVGALAYWAVSEIKPGHGSGFGGGAW
jgi:hypothetical protein